MKQIKIAPLIVLWGIFLSFRRENETTLQYAVDSLSYALEALNLSIEDLKYERKNAPTTWRLKVVDQVLDDPLLSPYLLLLFSPSFAGKPSSSYQLARKLLEFSDRKVISVLPSQPPVFSYPPEIVNFLAQMLGYAEELDKLFQKWRERFPRDALYSLPYLLVEEPEERWESLPAPETKWTTPELLALLEGDKNRNTPGGSTEHTVQSLLGGDPLITEIFQRTGELISLIENFVETFPTASLVSGERISLNTPFGKIVWNSPGDDITTCTDCLLVFDPGGNDRYDFTGQGKAHLPLSLLIDLGGNDTYESRDGGIANGFFGVGILVDRNGNDRYESRNFGLGAGYFGAGLLWDMQGDDQYFCGVFCLGAGGFGIGMVKDEAGNDVYHSAELSQGFGFTQGMGMLLDSSGNDVYYAGGVILHRPLYSNAYRSLSQGFAIGMRGEEKGGGIGILWDKEGNDSYRVEVYGQGAGYWYSWGALMDESGRDSYSAVIYCQGAGVHLAVGTLLDSEGDDLYSCTDGVGMGGGHDWAVGILVDFAGNDYYSGAGITQGGGNANGIGILVDAEGNDAYSASKEVSQGWGNPARDSFSIGILLDLAGKDYYTHGGKNASMWSFGFLGIGWDKE